MKTKKGLTNYTRICKWCGKYFKTKGKYCKVCDFCYFLTPEQKEEKKRQSNES